MSTKFDLGDRVAVVTGSRRAIVEALAARDFINECDGKRAASAFAASISEQSELRTLVARAKDVFGEVDISHVQCSGRSVRWIERGMTKSRGAFASSLIYHVKPTFQTLTSRA